MRWMSTTAWKPRSENTSINIASAGPVTFSPTDTPFGQAARNLPVNLSICQTNASGQCINPTTPTGSVSINAGANQTVTFSVFASGKGVPIPFDPAGNRIYVFGTQGSTAVGASSVAVRTQ